ncbi:MAG: hypothetical protein QOD37_2245, partial [Gaiellales bacterium]|nr:hypothetical protein [Gaiellales bacterium]
MSVVTSPADTHIAGYGDPSRSGSVWTRAGWWR